MKDTDKPIESTINMSLKPIANKGVKSNTQNNDTSQDNNSGKVNEKQDERLMPDNQSKSPAYAKKTQAVPVTEKIKKVDKDDGDYYVVRNDILKVVGIAILAFIIVSLVFTYLRNAPDYYYVESTISVGSENETEQKVLVLGTCVRDYTKEAKPDQMIDMVHGKYNYLKSETDLVQSVVSTGCDLSVKPQIITTGSLLQAIF